MPMQKQQQLLLLFLLCKARKRTLIILSLLILLIPLLSLPFPCISRWKRRLRVRKERKPACQPHKKQIIRHSATLSQFDIYTETGIFEDLFFAIFDRLKLVWATPRQTKEMGRSIKTLLHLYLRLLLVLIWLREYPKQKSLAQKFHID